MRPSPDRPSASTQASDLDDLSSTGSDLAARIALAVAATVYTLLVLGVAWSVNESNLDRERTARAEALDDAASAISERMIQYAELLRGLVPTFAESAPPSRAEFNEIMDRLNVEDRYPGVQVVGAALEVDSDLIAVHEASVRSDAVDARLHYPHFEVRPEPSAERALPIAFIEPQAGNEQAFGLDFYSEDNRRSAAETARDTGTPTLTAPVRLVQESGSQQAVLMMTPVYRAGLDVSTLDGRRAAFVGVVYAAFRAEDLINGVLGADAAERFSVVDGESGETLVGDTDASADRDDRSSIEIGNRTWLIAPTGETRLLSITERMTPEGIVAVGALIAGLLWLVLRSVRSARQRAVQMAAAMSAELAALQQATPQPVISIDESGRIVGWNQGAETVFGWSGAEIVGRGAFELVADEHHGAVARALELLADDFSSMLGRTSAYTAIRSSGERFAAEITVGWWQGVEGRRIIWYVRDVTDRERANRRLRATTRTLSGVLAAATEMAIIGTDARGMITVFNAGAERMLGYAGTDVVGVHGIEHFHVGSELAQRARELQIEPGVEVLVEAARADRPETRRWTYVRADGASLPADVTITPMRDEAGELVGFISIAVDATLRVETERANAIALASERQIVKQLTDIDRMKDDFVSNMSHELRTPLTSILGYLELMGEADSVGKDPFLSRTVYVVARNARRLLALVEDLLMLSRIESGALPMRREPCDVAALVAHVLETVRPVATERSISLTIEVPTETDTRHAVTGDPAQLEQAIVNLVSNAVKFSHDGGVVTARLASNIDVVRLEIRDTGVGIPADELAHVFDRFFRSRTATENAVAGTGLGLAIVQATIGRHGGTIELDSTEGVGTTVTITLPRGHPPVEVTDEQYASA